MPDALAHQGMLRAANYVADYIHTNRILDKAFDIVPVGGVPHVAFLCSSQHGKLILCSISVILTIELIYFIETHEFVKAIYGVSHSP